MKIAKAILSLVNEDHNDLFKQNLISPKRTPWLQGAIAHIEDGEKNKLIYNADFEEAKDRIKGCMYYEAEAAQETGAQKFPVPPDQGESWRIAKIYTRKDNPIDALKEIAKYSNLKDLKAMQFYKEEFVQPLADLYTRLLALKPFIQKGRKPKPVKEPAFRPAKTSVQDLLMVKSVYEDLLKEWYPKQVEAYKLHFEAGIKFTQELLAKNLPFKEFKEQVSVTMITLFFERPTMKSPYSLKKDWKKIIDREAEIQTKQIQDSFIAKNLSKVSSIVSAKGGLKTTQKKDIYTSSGTISGEIEFKFEDGSCFTVRNQVVDVWTYGVKPFSRFPTTFHDITMPDGKFKKKMSELEMNRDFAGIKV